MSTRNVEFDHPFDPDETLRGERVGVRSRWDDPTPLIRVRVGASTFLVERDTLRSDG